MNLKNIIFPKEPNRNIILDISDKVMNDDFSLDISNLKYTIK